MIRFVSWSALALALVSVAVVGFVVTRPVESRQPARSPRQPPAEAAAERPAPPAPGALPEAVRSGREAIAGAGYDLLDQLSVEAELTEAQYDRLAEVLESERAAGFATLDAGRPGPGRPPRRPGEVEAEMKAHRASADEAAAATLSSGQLTAWERLRAPKGAAR